MSTDRPPSGRFCASTLPECCSTMRWVIARPSPVPVSWVEKYGSKMRSSFCGSTPGPVSATSITTSEPLSDRRSDSSSRPEGPGCWPSVGPDPPPLGSLRAGGSRRAQRVLHQIAYRPPQQLTIHRHPDLFVGNVQPHLDAALRRVTIAAGEGAQQIAEVVGLQRRRGDPAVDRELRGDVRVAPRRCAGCSRRSARAPRRSARGSCRQTCCMCSVDSRIGVRGFLISWAMMRAISTQASSRWLRSTSVASSTTSSSAGSSPPASASRSGPIRGSRLLAFGTHLLDRRLRRRSRRAVDRNSSTGARSRASPATGRARSPAVSVPRRSAATRFCTSTRPGRDRATPRRSSMWATTRSTTCFSSSSLRRPAPRRLRRAMTPMASARASSSRSLGVTSSPGAPSAIRRVPPMISISGLVKRRASRLPTANSSITSAE